MGGEKKIKVDRYVEDIKFHKKNIVWNLQKMNENRKKKIDYEVLTSTPDLSRPQQSGEPRRTFKRYE